MGNSEIKSMLYDFGFYDDRRQLLSPHQSFTSGNWSRDIQYPAANQRVEPAMASLANIRTEFRSLWLGDVITSTVVTSSTLTICGQRRTGRGGVDHVTCERAEDSYRLVLQADRNEM